MHQRENERAILHSKRLGKDANEESYKSLANFGNFTLSAILMFQIFCWEDAKKQ